MEYSLAIPGWWVGLGAAFVSTAAAYFMVRGASRLQRVDLGKAAMELAYVNATVDFPGDLASGRLYRKALWLPYLAFLGCALGFVAAVGLTLYARIWDYATHPEWFHVFGAAYYVGVGSSFASNFVLILQYVAARRSAASVDALNVVEVELVNDSRPVARARLVPR